MRHSHAEFMRHPGRTTLHLALLLLAGCDDPTRGANAPTDVPGPRDGGWTQLPDGWSPDGFGPDDEWEPPPPDAGPPLVPPARASFGQGFTDLTAAIESDAPFTLPRPMEGMGPHDDVFALFGDVDHDGVEELVLSHWIGSRPTQRPPPAPNAVYRYDRGARRLVRAREIALPDMQPLSGVLDLDGDGVTDLLALDRDGTLAWGMGNGRYAAPVPIDPSPEDWGRTNLVTSLFLDDLDDDGWLDVLMGADCCRTPCKDLHAMFRTGPRRFDERPELLPLGAASKPYTVFSARFTPGDRLVMSVGWSCEDPMGAPVFYRQQGFDAAQRPRFSPWDPTPDDSVFRPSPGRYPTLASSSPMAALAEDLDGDGRLDLAVSLNPTHLLLRGGDAWPFTDVTRASGIATTNAASGRAMIPWGVAALDLDRDTRPDLVIAHGNDDTAWFDVPQRFIGPQHIGVYWNGGGMRFAPVPDALGLGRPGHYRAVSVTDLDGDADPDLAVGGQIELARVYRNDIDNGNGAIAFRLHGTASNHLGVGAWISLWRNDSDAPLRRYVGGAANPYTLNAPVSFFGLGASSRVARVEIAWPSGHIQTLRDLSAGRVVDVVEPEVLTLSPSTRHLPADGASEATVRVIPRDTEGRVRADATVEVTLTGDGTLRPAVRDGEGWTARVVSPRAPGSAVLTVRVNGRPMGVRPRVWWD